MNGWRITITPQPRMRTGVGGLSIITAVKGSRIIKLYSQDESQVRRFDPDADFAEACRANVRNARLIRS